MPAPSDTHLDATSSWQGSVDVTALNGGSGLLPPRTPVSLSLCCLWGTSMAMVTRRPQCAPRP